MIVGSGVIKGMVLTLREFIASYPLGQWLLRKVGKGGEGIFTIEYPETKQEHAERFRVFPFLVYDGTQENLRCVACKICEQECPPQCIYIEQAREPDGRPAKAHGRTFPKRFDIDTAICMSCRICVDVCPFDAIEMDTQFELSAYDRAGSMIQDKDRLLKSADYFRQIKPTESASIDQRLAAKAKKPAPAQPAPSSPSPATAPAP